ncbi:MAG: hypothetical protein OHK0013_42580 [Sandaracinaceae bacterium]
MTVEPSADPIVAASGQRPRYAAGMRRTLSVGWLLFCASGLSCGGPTPSTATETPPMEPPASAASGAEPSHAGLAPPALPAEIEARVHLPGPAPDDHLFVRVSLAPLPWTITGCVTGPHGACEETARVELDEADRRQLVQLLAEVQAIPRCEPEGLFPGDRAYRLALTGFPRTYEGHLPASLADLSTRNEGPCRADARLAWWIASRFQRTP